MKKGNIEQFPRGYIKKDQSGEQWIWLNGAFIHYEPMSREECIQMIKQSIKTNSSELWKILTFNLTENGRSNSCSTI